MRGHWRESALWTAIAAALVILLARRGITTYFFAEAFVYLGSYHAAGDSFLQFLLRPHAAVFYRPSIWGVNLAWNLIAPPDALVYHLRNVALIVVNALLLHRLLLRLVPDRFGRGVAMLFYAVSKVHLTTIGYVATFSTILVLFATLSMLVAFCRWLEERRTIDFVSLLFFAAFLTFSKDYGGVAIALLPLLAWERGADVRRTMRLLALPLVVIVVAYAGLRMHASPLPPLGDYEPRVELRVIARKGVQAASTLANLSLFETEGRTGARGVTRLIWPDDSRAGRIAEGVVLLAFLAFTAALVARGGARAPLIVFCFAWGALFFLPTLLGRNEQLYYHNDVVTAAAVLIGASSSSRWRSATVVMLMLLALNAEVSQRSMRYSWYEISEEVRPVEAVVQRCRAEPIERITFVASDRPRWDFALRAGPFVETLCGRPRLEVQVVDRRMFRGTDSGIVVDVDRWRATKDSRR